MLPLLSDDLFAVLERELVKGGWHMGGRIRRETLSRITTLIGRRFHMSYTVQGVAALLTRHGGAARFLPGGRSSGTRTWWPDG
ncbi:winged helix-turn-helix domain-containing protein [Streptomyces chartreusis]